VSYSKTLKALIRRLKQWSDNWDAIDAALKNCTQAPANWTVRPWVFVPQQLVPTYHTEFAKLGAVRFDPLLTMLEDTPPWKYDAPTSVADAAKVADLTHS
jgi:hypothetical protein